LKDLSLTSVNNRTRARSVVKSGITSVKLGRGYFEFTPESGNEYFLSDTKGNSYAMNISSQPEIAKQELTFSVTRKVLAPNENLEVRIFTNDKVKTEDVYIIGIFVKEEYQYLE
jgi:hypothetical protein